MVASTGYGYNYGYNYVKYNDELAFDDDYDKLAYSYNHDYEGCQFDNCNKYDCDHEYDYSCHYFTTPKSNQMNPPIHTVHLR